MSQQRAFAYIVDGKTLSIVFKSNLDARFRDVCMQCEAVLCCRMSPLQKAQVQAVLSIFAGCLIFVQQTSEKKQFKF